MSNLVQGSRLTTMGLMIAAASGSAALLAGAYIFQFFGFPPCVMCLWQRWPHGIAIILGIVAYFFPVRGVAILGSFALSITAGLGVYHTGVERDWWEGPTSCTGTGALDGLTIDQLLPGADGPKLVLCDQVSWQFLTLSMASWNALFSMLLVFLWTSAIFRK